MHQQLNDVHTVTVASGVAEQIVAMAVPEVENGVAGT